MIASASKRSLIDRMIGAALLETDVYQEVALLPSTRSQIAFVVIISTIAAGLGGLGGGLVGFVAAAFTGPIGWGLYVLASYWVATRRFGVRRTAANWGATWRALGLASSPRVFLVFALVPEVGLLVGLAVHAWVLITTVFAVKVTLDLETRPAIAASAAGLLPMLLVWALVAALL
jgi:hypothetical protein